MEIFNGFIMASLGIILFGVAIRWFVESDNWLSFVKSLLVALVGLLLLGLSIDYLKGFFY